jgi:hypothetical protein
MDLAAFTDLGKHFPVARCTACILRNAYSFVELVTCVNCGVILWQKTATTEMVANIESKYIPFKVFTAVVMKSTIFWDITPCSLLSVNRRFGGTYRLHLQGRRNTFFRVEEIRSRNHLLACWFLAGLISSTLKMEAIGSSETSVDTQRTTRPYTESVLVCTNDTDT